MILLQFSKTYLIYFRFGIMIMIKALRCLQFCAVSTRLSIVNQWRHHPRPHLNQQTQCHTKDSGFYLYFFICYRHSHNNRRETAASGRKKRQKQRFFTFVNFISAFHSPSFTISFSLQLMLSSFSLQIFMFIPAFKRRDSKERDKETIIVPYSQSFTVYFFPLQTKGQIH